MSVNVPLLVKIKNLAVLRSVNLSADAPIKTSRYYMRAFVYLKKIVQRFQI
jgi:hypothetical protein